MKSLLLCAILVSYLFAGAQPSVFDSVNKKRSAISKTGSVVLGTWGVMNVVAGIIGQGDSSGEQKQFYRATAISGVINLAFAGLGYFNGRHTANEFPTVEETFQKQAHTEKLFLFSVGLDLSAVAFGLYLQERGNRFVGDKRDQLQGAGKALVLQAASLAIFDGIMYLLQAKNGARLRKQVKNLGFLHPPQKPVLTGRF